MGEACRGFGVRTCPNWPRRAHRNIKFPTHPPLEKGDYGDLIIFVRCFGESSPPERHSRAGHRNKLR